MFIALFLLNVMAGALIAARGREIRKKSDPALLTGNVKDMVSDVTSYTKAVGTIEFAFGLIIVILAGAMLTMGGQWSTLLIGDAITIVVYVCALKLLKKHYM